MNECGANYHLSSLQWHDWCSHLNSVPHKWGEIHSPRKHFDVYVQSSHTTFLWRMMECKRVSWEEGEHRVAHEQVNWDSVSISVLLSMDSAGFPVALSRPQCLKVSSVSTLQAMQRPTLHSSHSTDLSANKLQYVFSTWAICTLFGFKRQIIFRMLCMNLNFKLFFLFF